MLADSVGTHLRQLLRLDRERFSNAIRRPAPVVAVATVLPALVLVSALWSFGRMSGLAIDGTSGGVTLGMLVSGPIAFMSYGILFGGGDDIFLRQVGIRSDALFLHRSIRLTAAGLIVGGALLIPFLAAGESLAGPAKVGLSVAALTAGTSALSFALAANATVGGSAKWMSAGMGQFDPGLARAAPLVYAPVLPFLAGAVLGAAIGSGRLGWLMVAFSLVLAGSGILLGARLFKNAAPRFVPHAREIAYVPPPRGEGERFRVGGGLTVLLPRRAAAVWVRDATVGSRRYAWASRVTWPVALVSIAALARWGVEPAARAWVIAAVGIALLVQAAAVIGLGGLERRRVRWIDRSSGLRWWERFLGRWAWAWGLSLWLLIPVALAWSWWSGVGDAWLWPIAGAVAATVAVAVSLLTAERPA